MCEVDDSAVLVYLKLLEGNSIEVVQLFVTRLSGSDMPAASSHASMRIFAVP